MIWRGFAGTALPPWLGGLIGAGRCGGIVLFARNVEDPAQVLSLSREACAAAGRAIPVAVDQEGGRVARLREPHFTPFPPARVMARAPADLVRRAGCAMATEMAAVGVNMDFAPVLDVQESARGVIGDRAFSGDPREAARLALAWLSGLESAGVRGCPKHFPGHGDASCDSHEDLPEAEGDLDRLLSRHLEPFRAACAAGVGAMMVAHLLVTPLDARRPSSLSSALVQGLLRTDLGFEGVVVTDDLEMGAVTRRLGVGEAAVLAVLAGCDALLVCESRERQEEATEALEREASSSPAFRSRIEESSARLEGLRATLATPPSTLRGELIRSGEHRLVAREIAR